VARWSVKPATRLALYDALLLLASAIAIVLIGGR
jgi:hypothetical protein